MGASSSLWFGPVFPKRLSQGGPYAGIFGGTSYSPPSALCGRSRYSLFMRLLNVREVTVCPSPRVYKKELRWE